MHKVDLSITDAIEAAVTEAFEDMFFTIVLGGPSAGAPLEADAAGAQVEFTGEENGRLAIKLSQNAAVEAAANFLGEQPGDVSSDQIDAVVRELANIVCGSALSRWRGDALFHLTPPVRIALDLPPARNAQELRFELEQGSLAVWIAFTAA